MFAAYSGNGRKNDAEQQPNREPYEGQRTRYAIQTVAKRNYEKEKAATEAEKESKVYTQIAYGESDSDEDTGGVKIRLPDEQCFDEEDVFVLPEKRKQMEAKKNKAENRQASLYGSFPTSSMAGSSNNFSERRSESSFDRHSSRRHEDRYAEKHRDGHRDRSRDRKRKKKHRRRSSSSSSSDSYSRRSRRRSPSPKRFTTKRVKYEFLNDTGYNTRNLPSNQNLYFDKHVDHEHFTIGQNKREIANCRLDVRFIDGFENNVSFFKRLYGSECTDSKKDMWKFHEHLASVAKHVPSETIFRPTVIADGFWKVSQHKDILNQLEENDYAERTDDLALSRRARLRKAVADNVYDIESLIEWLELEDELFRTNKGSFVKSDERAHIDRKLSIIEKAIKHNPRNATVHLMEIELLIQMDVNVHEVLDKYRTLAHNFPHEPMVWTRYLDFVQYDRNAYDYKTLMAAFSICFDKIKGLVEGTLLSHLGFVSDMPQLHLFQLTVYIRFLKWLIAYGMVPDALANIQATFELNFGSQSNNSQMKKRENLFELWHSKMPRIGDEFALGAEKTLESIEDKTPEDVRKLELVSYDILLHEVCKAKHEVFRSAKHIDDAWVQFERKILDLDARVKRTQLTESSLYTKDYDDELEGVMLAEVVQNEDLTPYYCPEDAQLDIVQPLLEVLGIVFHSTTGCFSLTEQVIDDWRVRSSVLEEEPRFDAVPTYSENTMSAVGDRILQFMLYRRHEMVKGETKSLDRDLVRYAMAILMTQAKNMEKSMLMYRLSIKQLNFLVEDCWENRHKELVNHYPLLRSVIRILASELFITWIEKASAEQADIMKHAEKAHRLGHVVTKKDQQNVEKARTKMLQFLNKCSPVAAGEACLRNNSTLTSTLQLHLYTNVLRARLGFYVDQKCFHQMLAMMVLEKDFKYVMQLEKQDDYAEEVKQGIREVVEIVKLRDSDLSHKFVPEVPRPGALALALQLIVDIAFLDLTVNMRQTVQEAVRRVLHECDRFEARSKDLSLRQVDHELDKLDVQFLLDTTIGLLINRQMNIAYNELFKGIIGRAMELFPCETKYMKLFTELNSGSIMKSMKLNQLTNVNANKFSKRRLERFDYTLERKLLLNSLSTMLGTLRVSSKRENTGELMVFQKFKQEALNLHDPAIWRLVLKSASRLGRKTLEQDAYIRAQGQCLWSFNIHVDFVEGMGRPESETSTPATKTILHLSQINNGTRRWSVIDDDEVLRILWNVNNMYRVADSVQDS